MTTCNYLQTLSVTAVFCRNFQKVFRR